MKTTSDNFIGHLEIKITDTALKFNEKDPKAYECLLKFAEVFKENDQISVEQRFSMIKMILKIAQKNAKLLILEEKIQKLVLLIANMKMKTH